MVFIFNFAIELKKIIMKNLLMIFIAVGMVFCSTAQKRNGFGIHAGVNTSDAWYIEDNLVEINPDTDPMPGYQVGLRYNIKFGPLGFCPEINYTSITVGSEETADGVTGKVSTTLNYVSVPLLLKLYIGGFNIHFGGQASTLLGGQHDNELSNTSGSDVSSSVSLKDESYYTTIDGTRYWAFQEIDLAAVVGFGIDTKMGLYGSWRTVMSLVPVENILLYNAANNYYGLPDLNADQINALQKAVSVQMSIGYKF